MNAEIPTFGHKEPTAQYQTRVGVHAIIVRPLDDFGGRTRTEPLSADAQTLPTFPDVNLSYSPHTGNTSSLQLCLLQTPNKAYYLPGGEIESGETQEETFKRELMEELGATAELGDFLGEAADYYYSHHRDQHYYNPVHIYIANNAQFDHEPLEAGNHICWLPINEAVDKLKRQSHQWGVQHYLKLHQM